MGHQSPARPVSQVHYDTVMPSARVAPRVRAFVPPSMPARSIYVAPLVPASLIIYFFYISCFLAWVSLDYPYPLLDYPP